MPAAGRDIANGDARFGLALYRSALRMPHVSTMLIGGLVGRLREGGIGLAIVFGVREATGSFTVAGAAAAVFVTSAALGRPVQGRLSSALGARTVLVAASAAHAAGVLVLAACTAAKRPPTVLLVVTAICGLLLPALSAHLRSSWPLVLPHERPTAYALDALTYDVSNTLGPALVALLAQLAGAAAGLVALAACGLTGTLLLLGVPTPPRSRGGTLAGTRRSVLRGAVGAVAGITALVAFAEGSLTVAVPGFGTLHHAAAASGYLLSAFAIGSLAGGFFYGARRWSSRPAARLVVCVLAYAAGLALCATTGDLVVMGAVILLAGVARAPTIATTSLLMDAASRGEAAIEAFAWMSVASAVGASVGQASAAVFAAIDIRLAFLTAGACVAGAALIARCCLWRDNPAATGPTGGARVP
ncbi:MAG: transporter [Dactylosporangium sp.]|nr:transporter [Dactylosporangium sp.]